MIKTEKTNYSTKIDIMPLNIDEAKIRLMKIVGLSGELEEFSNIINQYPELDLNYLNRCGGTLLITAARTGKVEIVKYLLNKNSIDPNIVDKNRCTFFHLIKSTMGVYSKFQILKLAILKGFDLDIEDVNGVSSRDIVNNNNLLSQLLNQDFLYDQNLDENIIDLITPIHDIDMVGQYDDMTL